MTTTEHLTCAETAKLVRQALKQAFPTTTFSVRSSTYSMGASIDVRWTDGPTVDAVNHEVKQYEGATFDAMQDLKEYKDNGYGADFVLCHRTISDEWREKIEAEVLAFEAIPVVACVSGFNSERFSIVSTEDRVNGGAGLSRCDWESWYGQDLVHQLAAHRDRSKSCNHTNHTIYHSGFRGTPRCMDCGEVIA